MRGEFRWGRAGRLVVWGMGRIGWIWRTLSGDTLQVTT